MAAAATVPALVPLLLRGGQGATHKAKAATNESASARVATRKGADTSTSTCTKQTTRDATLSRRIAATTKQHRHGQDHGSHQHSHGVFLMCEAPRPETQAQRRRVDTS